MNKKEYSMPYIKDKRLFAAVMFARSMYRDIGMRLALYRASKYYGVAQRDVAFYMGKFAGRQRAIKNTVKAYRDGLSSEIGVRR